MQQRSGKVLNKRLALSGRNRVLAAPAARTFDEARNSVNGFLAYSNTFDTVTKATRGEWPRFPLGGKS
ncbi:MAG: hypothetical protein NTW20_04505 [Rhodobacterales bacterium]|nr:hypothetical protein [Rhodobacterales bacterium]